MKEQKIRQLSDIEHVIKRKSMYFGNFSLEKSEQFYLKENKFVYTEVEKCPALLKMINEFIDNAVDEAIRTKFKFANKIEVTINEESIKIKDNGRGIPVKKAPCGTFQPVLAWTSLKTSGNYETTDSTTIGINGVGAVCGVIFSNKFRAVTSDGKKKLILTCSNNLSKSDYTISDNKQQYTEVYFEPDFSHFEVNKIDNIHINLIKQRLIGLSLLYPIKFILNNEEIKFNKSLEDYAKMFGENYLVYESKDKNFNFILLNNSEYENQYLTYSMVNGLEIYSGSHFEYIELKVLNEIKNELSKKKELKGITPTDLKNNFMMILMMKNLKNADYKSQTKEELAVKKQYISEFFSDSDLDKIVKRVLKEDKLIEPIKENYQMKLQIREMREIKANDKKIKKTSTKPSKLVEANSRKRNECELYLVEGDSAKTNFLPARDCETQACFPLKGKPLNVINKGMKEIYANSEIKELLQILGIGLLDMAVEFNNWTDKFFEIRLNENNLRLIVNEGDEIKIKDKWIKVKNIKKEDVKSINPYELNLKEFTINKEFIRREIVKNNMRYGKINILCDADYDGSDIKGLLLSLFTTYFPELFEGNMVNNIISPIMILTNKKERLRFFNLEEYREFVAKNQKKLNSYESRYVKGLAGLSVEDYEMILTDEKCKIAFDYNSIRDYKEILKSHSDKHILSRKEWLIV